LFRAREDDHVSFFEKDRLIKLLEQLTKMMLAIRAAIAAGLLDDALASIREARTALTGPLAGTIERVDAATVAALLGPEKAKMYAELAQLEAEVRAKKSAGPSA
jgi:mannose/fructose/N-acetylgalactosamine-specific phosphotransferase system component IID